MTTIVMVSCVFVLVILAYAKTRDIDLNGIASRKIESMNTIEVLPATKLIEVEVIDEMTKEKVRNLYEEQDVYNAKISYLTRQNKQYQLDIDRLDDKVEDNLNDMRTQMQIQPNMDMRLLKASFEMSNQNIYKHKLRLEGLILANAEKIVAYKKKSNAISEQITKIGKEIYARQMKG